MFTNLYIDYEIPNFYNLFSSDKTVLMTRVIFALLLRLPN